MIGWLVVACVLVLSVGFVLAGLVWVVGRMVADVVESVSRSVAGPQVSSVVSPGVSGQDVLGDEWVDDPAWGKLDPWEFQPPMLPGPVDAPDLAGEAMFEEWAGKEHG